MILRGSPDHRRPTDINVLDCFCAGDSRRSDGCFKRIEVDHDKIERFDPVGSEIGAVVGLTRIGQNSSVNHRVESLHSAAKHFGGAGYRLDRRYWKPGGRDIRCCRPRRHEVDARSDKT